MLNSMTYRMRLDQLHSEGEAARHAVAVARSRKATPTDAAHLDPAIVVMQSSRPPWLERRARPIDHDERRRAA